MTYRSLRKNSTSHSTSPLFCRLNLLLVFTNLMTALLLFQTRLDCGNVVLVDCPSIPSTARQTDLGIAPDITTCIDQPSAPGATASLLRRSPNATNATKTQLVKLLRQLPASAEQDIWDALHGQEYPFPLTCPGRRWDWSDATTAATATSAAALQSNYSIIVGYHVGMMKNWREIVRDQLRTLHQCGLADRLSQLYVSYSNDADPVSNPVLELKDLLQRRYPALFAKTEFYRSAGQPIEGTAINALHARCVRDYPMTTSTTSTNTNGNDNNKNGPNHDTVAFYFHTKGSSRYDAKWQQHIGEKFSYSNILAWRKYMEYFTIERPDICIDHIINRGIWGCGVFWLPFRHFYGGNFWAASCKYLRTLKPLTMHPLSAVDQRWMAEGWITEDLRVPGSNFSDWSKFVYPHNPPRNLYNWLIQPRDYSDYHELWWRNKKK